MIEAFVIMSAICVIIWLRVSWILWKRIEELEAQNEELIAENQRLLAEQAIKSNWTIGIVPKSKEPNQNTKE